MLSNSSAPGSWSGKDKEESAPKSEELTATDFILIGDKLFRSE